MLGRIASDRVTTFTFNDTILVILKCGSRAPELNDITSFFAILRKFLVDSMQHRILLRGSISIGSFYVDDPTNTVMGQAVTDAAAWYDKAEWIGGVHATPHATIMIQRWLEHDSATKGNVMPDYDIPLKNVKIVRVKAVNWPKVFFVPSISPCRDGERPREKLLEFLAMHQVPRETECKYYNTIAFFDDAVKVIKKQERRTSGSTVRKIRGGISRR
ncbi:MAG: hypothetical protein NTX17_04940 [Candidatus Eisenbacteria bacterium]|nr:hypothetical protein [Candidatus Eisenbacteria bacterium]